MKVGESWAYRARAVDSVILVEVLKIGSQKPARVRIRFVDSRFEGREEWVSPGRLKVLWSGVEEFVAREQRWKAVTDLSRMGDSPEVGAAFVVFDRLIDEELAEFEGYRYSVLKVHDVPGLAKSLGQSEDSLLEHPASFVEDGLLVAPWPVAEQVARRAAARSVDAILNYVDQEERKAQHEAIHGKHVSWGRGQGHNYIEPADCVDQDYEFDRPVRELLRAWCGQAAVDRLDELKELRKEVRRLGDLAEQAVTMLRGAGRVLEAERLKRELGTPVELLRQEQQV
jgi:hypothetical protein